MTKKPFKYSVSDTHWTDDKKVCRVDGVCVLISIILHGPYTRFCMVFAMDMP